LHLRSGGKPYTEVWNDYLRAHFQFLDRDGNGVLDKAEAERAPRAQNLRALLGGNFFNASPGATVSLSQLDTNPKDGKVSLEEFAYYYDRFGLSAFQKNYTRVHGTADNPLTESLFKHLDANADSKLTRDEVQKALLLLGRLDLNEDEAVNAEELVPALTSMNPFQVQIMAGPDNNLAYLPREAPFALLAPGESTRRLVEQLLERYDRTKDQKLIPAEVMLDPAAFGRLDGNQDGQLDAAELRNWASGPADLELVLELGKKDGKEAIQQIPAAGGKAQATVQLRATEDGMLILNLDDAQIEFVCSSGPRGGFDAIRKQVLEQFQNADPDKKGFITKKDADLARLFTPWFSVLDRDGDGKVTKKEVEAFLDLQAKAATSATVLSLADHGRMLFDVLDTNRDGRLGLRELRAAWGQVSAWDRGGIGALTREAIPRRYQAAFSQGQTTVRDPREPVAARMAPQRGGRTPPKGPVWFLKMDRNGDGDVSPREFLGSPDEFKRLDADRDGLIDAAEAQRADGALRKGDQRDR
jgi:Ca2+-binding EF-hand superfamily protein